MKVIDVCTYNGEKDIWDIHYNVLKDYVDEFIVVEFDKTFSGQPKSFTFSGFYPKVKYVKHTLENYAKYRDLALSSPNTTGASHWKLEFMQKESIKDALTHLDDDDLVFIGDVDEIWIPTMRDILFTYPMKLKLKVYAYYLNNRSSEEFWGTLMTQYRDVKDSCLNHVRSTDVRNTIEVGWHFTSMGGYKAVEQKLLDSYTSESYATPEVLSRLEENMAQNKDFLGRPFTYEIDESEWPQYLKDNRNKYAHLLK